MEAKDTKNESAVLIPPLRKKEIDTRTSELEALEARIRDMERRLQGSAGTTHPGLTPNSSSNPPAATSPRSARAPVSNVFDRSGAPPSTSQQEKDYRRPPTSSSQHKGGNAGSRPGTARQSQQAVPGALPPTPTASDGEYHPFPFGSRDRSSADECGEI